MRIQSPVWYRQKVNQIEISWSFSLPELMDLKILSILEMQVKVNHQLCMHNYSQGWTIKHEL